MRNTTAKLLHTLVRVWIAAALVLATHTDAHPLLHNITISVPEGTSIRGKNLICAPTKWTDVVLFFVLNYLTHCVTVRINPGSSTIKTLIMTSIVLFIKTPFILSPFSGFQSYNRHTTHKTPAKQARFKLSDLSRIGMRAIMPKVRSSPVNGVKRYVIILPERIGINQLTYICISVDRKSVV